MAAGARAKKANATFESGLVTSASELNVKLGDFQQDNKANKPKSMDFLKGQFNRRLQLKRPYPSTGDAYRSSLKPKKLIVLPPDGPPASWKLPLRVVTS